MKNFNKLLINAVSIWFILLSVSFSQTDTVIVPDNYDGDYYGAINRFIKENPGHGYYKLEVGKYYLLNAPIEPDSNLNTFRLIADKPDPTDPSKFPAVVAMGDIPSDRLLRFFILDEDARFENIYFLGAHPTLNLDVNVPIEIIKNGGKYYFDGCYFDRSEWVGIMVTAIDVSVKVTNTLVKNFIHPSSRWNARFLSFRDNPVDTCIMTNNTYYSANFVFLDGRKNIFNYLQFEHNTLVNVMKWPIQWQWATNAEINDNLYYNAHAFGEGPNDLPGQDFDGLLFGLVNVDTLLTEHHNAGLTEMNRKVEVKNNNWFYSQEITNYWDSFSSSQGVEYEPFMNTRTQHMFDSDDEWPGLIESDTRNLDPGLKSIEGTDEMVDWMGKDRTYQSRTWWFPDADGNPFTITWPLREDLSYTNTELETGGQAGFPVGDLNWWGDDKVSEWEIWRDTVTVGVKKNSIGITLDNYSLEQNYPNPFNPSTVISYSIPKTSNVQLSVYNSLGQKTATLVNQKQNSGSYSVNWNGKDQLGNSVSTGIYFYQIRTGNFIESRKMILLR
ncbi:MAG: T9SS type A sorting domain-containing protein [Bacteroidota bacterium]